MNITSSRSAVIAGNGMVATSQPLATGAGLDILKKGGSAVDAAIAANAALGLVEPHMCGLGGDLFAIVWDEKEKQLHGLNASGRSPGSLDHGELSERLRGLGARRIPANSILSVSVPGAAHGWTTLHDRFGKLPKEVNALLLVVRIKSECRKAGVARLDTGPKGATVQFHEDRFANPDGLVEFIRDQNGLAKIRNNKLIVRRDWRKARDRVQGAFVVARDLASKARS